MKHYKRFFAISLLVLLMNQILLAGQVFEQALQQVTESQVSLQNLEFPQHSTDQYLYTIAITEQPADPELVVAPVVISDTTVGNYFNNGKTRTLITQETKDGKVIITTETWKTKSPSYLTWSNGALVIGAVGVAALTYMKLCQLKNDFKQVQIQIEDTWKNNLVSFKSEKADSIEGRRELIDNMFMKFMINFTGAPDSKLNANIIYHVTEHISKPEFINFLENLDVYTQKKNAFRINLGDIAHVLEDMKLEGKISDSDLQAVKQSFKQVPDFWPPLQQEELAIHEKHQSLAAAYHEAGHALVGALLENQPILYASIFAHEDSGGHIQTSMTSLYERFFGYKDVENYRHDMKRKLASGIAMSLLENRAKPSLHRFIYSFEYGMGDQDSKGTDIYQVYQDAENYFLYSDPISWFSPFGHAAKVDSIIEACYDEVYDILDAHREELAQLGDELYKKKVLSARYIYDVANSTQPAPDPIIKYLSLH